MLKQHKQIATADDNADERPTSLAWTFLFLLSWWPRMPSKCAKTDFVSVQYATVFHIEVGDLVGMDAITEEMTQKPQCKFEMREKEGGDQLG